MQGWQELGKKMLKCPTCGSINEYDAKRCNQCGAWLLDEYWKATKKNPSKSILAKWELWVIIMGIIGIYFLASNGSLVNTTNQTTSLPAVSNTPSTTPNKVGQNSTNQSTTLNSEPSKVTTQSTVTQKTKADQDLYYSQFSWYNSEFGVKNDSATNTYGILSIKGRAIAFKKDYSYVQITYGIYSDNGNKLGTAFANINNLNKGTTWQFEAIGASSVSGNVKYKLESISGW